MTYERINFVDQSVERPRTYEMTYNADGSVTLVDSFGLVDELGTPINADTMNHIEDGIAATAIRKYNENETFALGDWVLGVVENKKNIYKSLQDNNVGNSLNDKSYWEVVELGGGGGHDLFDIVQKDHILSYEETQGYELLGNYVYKEAVAGSRYGYPDFYAKCLEEKNAGTATQVTLGENTITMYVNANGHQFFDIANKDAVDAFYNATGTAWFYGVDTANERILLPRNDYYFKNGSTGEVGNNIEAGLPELELTNETDVTVQTGGVINAKTGSVQIAGNKIGSGGGTTAYANTSVVGFNLENNTSINTSSSTPSEIVSKNSIYGNSDTVQPPSVSVLAYMVVGNTKSTSGYSEIVEQGREILLQVNDGIESRADISLSNVTRTSGLRKLIEVSDSSLSPSWYKVFEETNPQTGEVLKWCVQGGETDSSEVVFIKEFKDTNYVIFKNVYSNSSQGISGANQSFYNKTTTSAKTGGIDGCWLAMGYIN